MKKTVSLFLIVAGVICLFAFQNCGTGFQAITISSVAAFSNVTPVAPTPAPGIAVQLAWQAPTSGNAPTGYNIMQSTDGSNFSQVQQAAASLTSTVVSGLSSKKYYFRVVAVNQAAETASQTVTIDLTGVHP